MCERHGIPAVSIHAPAWGATVTRSHIALATVFQFTRPHGARQTQAALNEIQGSFNSRARMGRDKNAEKQDY